MTPSVGSLFRAVREHYGLSQTHLAAYLGTTRDALAHAETSEARSRNLPALAYLRLAPLTLALLPDGTPPPDPLTPDPEVVVSSWPVVAPGPPPTQPPAADPLAARRDSCLFQADSLARRLAPLERRAWQAGRLLALLPTLAAAQPPHPHPDRLARTLAFLEAEARDQFHPSATASRLLLATRRAALLHEAAALTRIVPELPQATAHG